jgi:hypothetical protein
MGVTIDRELWQSVTAAVKRAARAVRRAGRRRRRRPVYSDALVVRMYLWSVWHDRPLCWACDRGHYTTLFRPRRLPSVSQFARRVKSPSVADVLARVHDDLAGAAAPAAVTILDGKPLPVGPPSRDPDAARGRVSGGFAKGYKLHAAVTGDGRVAAWDVRPLNVAESTVAVELVARLARPGAAAAAVVLADSAYDAAPLHAAVAAAGARLHCPLRGQNQLKGGRHHPVTLRQMGPARRAAVAYWRDRPDDAARELGPRSRVETTFAALTASGGGLTCLPAWVRTLTRVSRWVGAKIALYHARLRARKLAAA